MADDVTSSQSSDDSFTISAGEGMKIDEDSPDKTGEQVKEEDTSTKNDTQASDKSQEVQPKVTTEEQPKTEAEGDSTKQKSEQLISQLGEEKKQIATKLIELARTSDVAEEQVKKLMEDNPSIKTYVKTKFGNDYDNLIKEKKSDDSLSVGDLKKIREEERIKAKADVLLEQLESNKTRQLEQFAESHGFNTDERASLEKYVKVIEQEDGFDAALEKSAILVNASKAQTKQESGSVLPTGQGAKAPSEKEVKVTPEILQAAREQGRSVDEIVAGLRNVEDSISEEGGFALSI